MFSSEFLNDPICKADSQSLNMNFEIHYLDFPVCRSLVWPRQLRHISINTLWDDLSSTSTNDTELVIYVFTKHTSSMSMQSAGSEKVNESVVGNEGWYMQFVFPSITPWCLLWFATSTNYWRLQLNWWDVFLQQCWIRIRRALLVGHHITTITNSNYSFSSSNGVFPPKFSQKQQFIVVEYTLSRTDKLNLCSDYKQNSSCSSLAFKLRCGVCIKKSGACKISCKIQESSGVV